MRFLLICLIPLLLLGCASVGREKHLQFRGLFKSGELEQALLSLDKSPYAEEENSELLYLFEKGMVFFRAKDYKHCIEVFQKAKSLIRELYTISISKKVKSFVTDDTSDNYYGQTYERSYLHYYLAMAYLRLYQDGEYYDLEARKVIPINSNQRNNHLYSARAEMVAWDSFFKTVQRNRSYKTLYFNDIYAKLFAGIVHESIGKRNESQTALRLYKDAMEMLPVLAPLYRDYNKVAKAYSDKFFTFIQKNKKEEGFGGGKSSSQKRKQYNRLRDYVSVKYYSLLKELDLGKYRGEVRRQKFSKKVKKLIGKGKANVNIVLEMGMVPIKDAKKINLSLDAAFNPKYSTAQKLIAVASNVAIRAFAYDVLGLKPGGVYLSNSGVQVFDHYNLGGMVNVATPGPYLMFQVPTVENDPSLLEFNIVVEKKGKRVATHPLALGSSMGELARINNTEQMGSYLLKTGSRFLMKQGLAILAAYGTYKSLMKNGSEGLAKTMALASYLAGTAAISLSEQADLRHWTTLPKEIHLSSFSLPEGDYQVFLEFLRNQKAIKTEKLDDISITSNKPYIFSYRKTLL